MSTPAGGERQLVVRRAFADARDDLFARWKAQPDPSPFTHPDVCLAAAEAFGLATSVWMNETAAALAYEKRVGIGPLSAKALALPQLVPVSAPILAPPPSESDNHRAETDLDALVRALSGAYAQATFALPASWRDPRPFAWAGWSVESRFTYVVDLPTDSASWSSGRRQDARTYADDFEIRMDVDSPQLAAEFQAEAYHRKEIAFGPSVPQMTRLAHAMQDAGCLRTVVAWQGETARAAALFAVAGTRATYWLAGSEPGPAMTVLFATAFDALAKEGIKEVDLGGANVRSVAEFKRQFGARLVPTFRVRHIGPRWLDTCMPSGEADDPNRQLVTTLIVNADDFGLSQSINRGIREAHTNGIVTSATWLAGGDAADDAVALGQATPQLEIGLHLALTSVRPIGDPSPFRTILDREGRWQSGYGPVVRWMLRTPDARRLIRAEWQAQLNRFIDRWGRLPSHLDSHQHIALIPGLMRAYIELAAESGIHAIRAPREVRDLGDLPSPRALHRIHETLVLSRLADRPHGLARRAGISVPDSFAGFRQSGRMDEATLLALLPHLGERGGSVELMVHPGTDDEPGSYLRRQERDALMSLHVREALAAHGLQLGRFADLP